MDNPFKRIEGNPNKEFDALKKLSSDARRHQDRDVWLNIAFYLGEQYTQWVTLKDGTGYLAEISQVPGYPATQEPPGPVINKIMHFVNQQLAYAMQSKPVADALPANDSVLGISDSNVANAYINYLQEPNVAQWEDTLWNANLWALVANEAYIKWVYSEKLKRPDMQFVPSVDLYSDPYVRNFYKAKWVIHSQFMDPEQVYDIYGRQDIKPTDLEKQDLDKAEMLREMGQAPVMQGITVNELWMLPCRRYPKGLFHVWAGRETLIDRAPYPYQHGGTPALPFTQMGVIPRPNSKHYASPVTFMRAPQAELNRYHSQRINTRESWALLKLWLPEEIQLEKPWDNSPNQILRGSAPNGIVPQIIGPPGAMPDNADGEWIAAEMADVIGIHPVSEGQVPGRVEAAKAIELLRESDTSRLAVLIATTGTTVSRGWYQTLMNARQFHQDKITVVAYGKEGLPEVKHFYSDRFDPGTRIRVTVGSGLAFSRAARLDQLTVLWTNGILRDPEAFAQLADIPIPQVISAKQWDVKLARNENLEIAAGHAKTANSWDDHTIHLREHNNYRKSAEFQLLNDIVKMKFEHHCSEHKTMELTQLQEDAQKAAAMQATIGPPPGQSQGTFYKDAAVGPGANSGGATVPQ